MIGINVFARMSHNLVLLTALVLTKLMARIIIASLSFIVEDRVPAARDSRIAQ